MTQTEPQNDTIYTYREPQSQEELEVLLKIRYKSFIRGYWDLVTPKNIYEMDIDAFDVNAIHFGLFIWENNIEKPIGYVRCVTENEAKHAVWIKNILEKCPELNIPPAQFSLPLQGKLESKDLPVLQDFMDEQKNKNYDIVEVSRITVDENYTSIGILYVFSDFVFCTNYSENAYYLLTSKTILEKAYVKNGFVRMDHLSFYIAKELHYLYYVTAKMLPEANHNKIDAMHQLYQQNKSITFNLTKQTYA